MPLLTYSLSKKLLDHYSIGTRIESFHKYNEHIKLKSIIKKLELKNKIAIIHGPTKLMGAEVMATDLRASVSLVLAGLIAENRTKINRIYHLDRGYESLEKKLKNCKAEIRRV